MGQEHEPPVAIELSRDGATNEMGNEYVPYATRQKLLARAGQPVILEFDALPSEFKVQIFDILRMVLGDPGPERPAGASNSSSHWRQEVEQTRHE